MIDHKCCFVFMRKAISDMNLTKEIQRSIKSTPFGHFLDCPPMKVDSALLDDTCSHWVGRKFHFNGEDGEVLKVTDKDIWLIFNIPYKGFPIELGIGDHNTIF